MKAMSAVTTHRQATLGQLQNLSCPLLEKLRDSLEYVRAAVELQDIPTSDCKLLMKGAVVLQPLYLVIVLCCVVTG